MKLRNVVLAAAGLGIPLAFLILISPLRWGYGGYIYTGDGAMIRVVVVDPGGPADRAGMRLHDVLEPLYGLENLNNFAGPVGTTVHFIAHRAGKVFPLRITFEPFPPALARQETLRKVIAALTAIAVFIIAIVVILRARHANAGDRAGTVLALAGWYAIALSAELVAPSVWLAVAARYTGLALGGGVLCVSMLLLAIFPPNPSRLRSRIGRIAPWLLCVFVAGNAVVLYGVWASPPLWSVAMRAIAFFAVAVSLLLAVALVDAIATAAPEYRTATRWLAGSWLVADAIETFKTAVAALGIPSPVASHYGDVLLVAQTFLWAFGVGYPVMRHRLVDLNILITRATVFAAVSMIIVCIFVAAEWAVGRIFEQSLRGDGTRGWIPEAVTLGIVLALGLSARWIHRFVETRLTQIFFRKRLMGLNEIQRLAREVDAATDAQDVMTLACSTVRRCLEPLGVACYLRAGEAYPLVASNGAVVSPAVYPFNDEIPLRLRRFLEPFEIDDDSDARYHMLFLPMTLRGEVLGFLCCGPKPDRTPYPHEEIEALAFLAHQIGIASAWLQRTPPLATTPLSS